jgi:ABC-2 type transport system permease protein
MKVLWSAYYEFIKNIRDIRVLVAIIAFPISIILILGTVFDGKLTEDFKEKIPVGHVILDKGEIGKGFESLLSKPDISKLINVKQYSTQNAAAKDIEVGKIDNYFVVDEDTTRKLHNGEATTVNIYGKKNIELVQALLEGYISKSNAYSTAMSITKTPIIEKPAKYFERITPLNKKLPKAIDFYSVLTLLQMMSLGSMLGIFIVSRNKESNIHIRLYALPISKWTVIYGKVIGSSLFLFISCIVTVIFTKYVYHANWDGNLIVIGGALMAFSFLNIGVGILLASFTRNIASAIGISFVIMFVTSVAAGSIVPMVSLPGINIINPIYYTKALIFGALYSYPNQVMLKSALGLLVMIVAVYMLSFLKLRRVNYDNV